MSQFLSLYNLLKIKELIKNNYKINIILSDSNINESSISEFLISNNNN